MKSRQLDDKIECFLTNVEGSIYIIPLHLQDLFEGVPYYERQEMFEQYILPDEATLESVLIDTCDMQAIIDGDFY